MMAPIVMPAACVFALLAIGTYAAVLNRVNRDRGGQRKRLKGLGRLCLPLGPLVGVGLAGFIAAVAFVLFASDSSP
jgi:hypothetical protein